MRLNELFDKESFGVPTPSAEELAKKHGVSLDEILSQVEKGTKIEKEHTKDEVMAKEIALDHIAEFPDYYDRLKDMEANVNESNETEQDIFLKLVGDVVRSGAGREEAKELVKKIGISSYAATVRNRPARKKRTKKSWAHSDR